MCPSGLKANCGCSGCRPVRGWRAAVVRGSHSRPLGVVPGGGERVSVGAERDAEDPACRGSGRTSRLPELRAFSSAAIMLRLACGVDFARTASRPRISATFGCVASCALAAAAGRATRPTSRPVGVAPLYERPDPDRRERGDEREQDAADDGEPADRGPPVAVVLVAPAPLEDRLAEDVVVELVAHRLGLVHRRRHGPKQATVLAAAELVEDGGDLGLGSSRPLGQIGCRVRDLRLRRLTRKRKRSAAAACSGRVERPERLEQVVLDDALRAAQVPKRLDRQPVRACGDRRAPEPLHDQLEEGRLDSRAPRRRARRCRAPRAPAGRRPPPRRPRPRARARSRTAPPRRPGDGCIRRSGPRSPLSRLRASRWSTRM